MKDNKVERARQKAMMFGRQFLQDDTRFFDQALGAHGLATVMSMQAPGCRERIYARLDTLRLFVGQVLSADRACQDVVGRRLSERIAQGQSNSALSTGSYCDARSRLPQRPDRIESRAKKRRPKNLPLLTMPRQVARDLILAQRMLNRVP